MKNVFVGALSGVISSFLFTSITLFSSSKKDDYKINWVEPSSGWEVDYNNNKIYAVAPDGSNNINVGIGTNNPLSRFHLVGDFYNQGFNGVNYYYDPGVPSWSNVATLNYTSHGTGEDNSVVLIFAHLITNNQAMFGDGFIRVLRDGTPIAIACGGTYGDYYNYSYFGITLVAYDQPSPGTHTYTLQRESVLPQYGYNFFVIELKR
jgi:hypothetical protein